MKDPDLDHDPDITRTFLHVEDTALGTVCIDPNCERNQPPLKTLHRHTKQEQALENTHG